MKSPVCVNYGGIAIQFTALLIGMWVTVETAIRNRCDLQSLKMSILCITQGVAIEIHFVHMNGQGGYFSQFLWLR